MLDIVFKYATKYDVSDIHLIIGKKPCFRIDGLLTMQEKFPEITKEHIDEFIDNLNVREELQVNHSIDASFYYENLRYRVHIYNSIDGYAISLRTIPTKIPKFEELHLPDTIKKFTKLRKGLVLITGPTGSGKSTTMASIVEEINKNRNSRIITVEDPIEYVYEDKQSIITQRELGKNFKNFSGAVREAMREDPDIMVIGEMRDLETIQNAITLAETGHLVFATIHTKSASETFDRLIDVFSGDQQKQIRYQLSTVIEGVISQTLVPKIDEGRIPLIEVLIANSAIRSLIRKQSESSVSSIQDQMLMNNKTNGSQTFDQSIVSLYREKLITEEVAREYITNEKLL